MRSRPASVASVEGSGFSEGPIFDYDSEEAGTASVIRLDNDSPVYNSYGQGEFAAALSNGQVISGVLGYDYDTFADNPENVCIVYGHVTVG